MNRLLALALLLPLAACQSMGSGGTTRMSGSWASTDGIFVASFGQGRFTSRDPKTDVVLAEGTYTVNGDQIQMDWLSVTTKQQRSATCRFAAPDRVSCAQAGAGGFDLARA